MRPGAVAGIVLLALSLAWAPARADGSDLDTVRGEIAALERQIRSSQAAATDAGRQVAAAQSRLSEVLDQLAAREAEVEAIQARVAEQRLLADELEQRIAVIEAALVETRGAIVATEARLEGQAVDLYIAAASGAGVSVLSFASAGEVAVGLVYAGDVYGQTQDLLSGFVALREAEERQQAEAESRAAEAEAVLDRLQAEQANLEERLQEVEDLRVAAEAEVAAARELLDRINREIRQAEEHKEGLEADAARLQREIEQRASSSSSSGTSSSRPDGLIKPINGRISSPYGYRVHPILGTRRLHTGIDLAAGTGTPIKAAGSGTVILAGRWGGYGNAVVIDHGGGLTTVYAHQSRIAVSSGAQVSRGATIGYVGCTGYCTGPHLHFETRVNGTPVDPMRFLR